MSKATSLTHRPATIADCDAHKLDLNEVIATLVAKGLVDTRPVTMDLAAAMAYSGLSKTTLNELLREEKITARKFGTKNLYERESIDRYLKSLPAWGTQHAA